LNSKSRTQPFGPGTRRAESRDCQLPAAGCLLVTACCLLVLLGCRQQMADQPRYQPLAKSTFFDDGRSARDLVPGTVAQGYLRAEEPFYTGKSEGQLATALPVPLTQALLERGQERFNIYCAPCHDRTGGGRGMIVQRGYRQPPSYHVDRLREAPIGHFFEVITKGFGAMPDYAEQVRPADRWAIAAYIRALQLSQNATLADVPPEMRQQLQDKQP
jgi:mono/diheme cytochrome c family protein